MNFFFSLLLYWYFNRVSKLSFHLFIYSFIQLSLTFLYSRSVHWLTKRTWAYFGESLDFKEVGDIHLQIVYHYRIVPCAYIFTSKHLPTGAVCDCDIVLSDGPVLLLLGHRLPTDSYARMCLWNRCDVYWGSLWYCNNNKSRSALYFY